MKIRFFRRRLPALIISLALAASFVGALPTAADAASSFDGFITNGDFETGSLTGWRAVSTASIVEGGHDGSGYCVRLSGTSWVKVQQDVAVEPNTNYRLTGWVKRVSGVGAHYLNAKGSDTLDSLNSTTAWFRYTTPDWMWHVFDFNSGDNTTVNIRFEVSDIDSVFLYDDISLRKLTSADRAGYINNGDFEAGFPNGWQPDAGSSVVSGGYQSGYAMRVDGLVKQYIRVDSMSDYRVTARTKRVSGSGSHELRVQKGMNVYEAINGTSGVFSNTTDDWEEHSFEFNSGKTTQVTLFLAALDAGTTYLYDDVTVEKIKTVKPDYSAVLKGDVNLDGNVDASDLELIGAHGGALEGAAEYAADMNCDGVVTDEDARMLGDFLALGEGGVMALYPARGETVANGNWQIDELLHDYYPGKSDDYSGIYFGMGGHTDQYARDPVLLRWISATAKKSYTVLLTRETDPVTGEPAFTNAKSYIAHGTELSLQNLFVDTDYYWRVDGGGELASGVFHTAKTVRTFYIEGVSNTRDLGGWLTEDGLSRVKYDAAFRSAHFDHITAAGREAVADIGLKTDIDLRADGEGLTAPLGSDVTWLRAGPDGTAMYYTTATNSISNLKGSHTQGSLNALRVFADASNLPACFHCAYGRDRTGTVGILLLGMLGVSYYDIVKDYEMTFLTAMAGETNTTIKSDEAATKTLNWIIETYPADSLKESTELYLLAAGMKESEITAIRKNLLEPLDGSPVRADQIEVTTLPRKLSFLEGKGRLNVVGGKITVRYNIGVTEEIWMDKSMVSGFDNTVVGTQTLTVEYMGATATYDVEITPKSLTRIAVTVPPTKLEYTVGEELDTTDMEVTAYYDNDTSEVLGADAYEISGFVSEEGEHTVTVSAGGFSDSFVVTVTADYMLGDLDLDGEITVGDALKALRIAAKLVVPDEKEFIIADVDFDGEITVGDALKILRVAAKLIDKFI